MYKVQTQRKQKEAIRRAEAHGFEVLQGSPTRLLLDIDSSLAWDHYLDVFERIQDVYDLEEVNTYRSKSGNRHVVLKCRKADVRTRIALEAALGSDPVRAAISLAEVENGVAEPSILFRPKVTTEEG